MKFMQIKPQKARGQFKESLWTDPAWSAEIKYDGDRRIAQFCSPWVRFTGTRESVGGTGYVDKTANLPQLHIAGVPCKLEGTVLDGEIVAPWTKNLPGGESKWVTSIMGSTPERAVQIQRKKGWLEYMVFDCLYFKGQDVRGEYLRERRLLAGQALRAWDNKYAILVEPYATLLNKKAAWENAREGLVFKHQDHTYGNQNLWVKLKKSWTADVVITGFVEGQGKYQHNLGALAFGQYKNSKLVQVGTCSGMDDSLRIDLWQNWKKYQGNVIEIEHNGREPTGAFRHPRFKRFRPDKSPKDCVYREDET